MGAAEGYCYKELFTKLLFNKEPDQMAFSKRSRSLMHLYFFGYALSRCTLQTCTRYSR